MLSSWAAMKLAVCYDSSCFEYHVRICDGGDDYSDDNNDVDCLASIASCGYLFLMLQGVFQSSQSCKEQYRCNESCLAYAKNGRIERTRSAWKRETIFLQYAPLQTAQPAIRNQTIKVDRISSECASFACLMDSIGTSRGYCYFLTYTLPAITTNFIQLRN